MLNQKCLIFYFIYLFFWFINITLCCLKDLVNMQNIFYTDCFLFNYPSTNKMYILITKKIKLHRIIQKVNYEISMTILTLCCCG